MIDFYYEHFTIYDQFGQVIGRPGDRLEVTHAVYDHVGTLAEDGRVWACSYRFNGIKKVSIADFSGNKPFRNLGNIGNKSRWEVLRAYEECESDGYNLLNKNCEQVDNFMRGLGYKSDQLFWAGFGLAAVATAFAITQSMRK